MRTEFKEDDYIVVLKLGSITTDCAKENYCFKQREDDECLTPVCDLVGCRNNANRTLKFDKSDKLLDWRYATDKEIIEYDNIGKPYEVTPIDGLPQQYLPINHPDNHSNIPEKWYMLLDGLSDEGLEVCNEWRKSVCTIRAYASLEQHHILLNCHEDGSYYYGTSRVYDLKNESWANGIKEITFEQFIKYILKQNNKTVMTKQKLTVPITDVLKIHSIACSTWKERIAKYLSRVDNAQDITFDQEEVDAMFRSSTPLQLPTLENIFGKQVKEPTLKVMADGKLLFRENANEGLAAMIEVRIGEYSDLKDKAFWLHRAYNWELKSDNEGALCLVPTPKQ